MELDKNLIGSLLEIDWFSCCGKDIVIDDVLKAQNITSVKKTIRSVKYENIVLEYHGDFTSALFISYRTQYNEWWNLLVKQFKAQCIPQLKKIWKSKLEPMGLNEKYVIDDISFNVLSIAVIGAYKEQIPMPVFFHKMLEIYKNGYLICGWKGKKDSGSFIVY